MVERVQAKCDGKEDKVCAHNIRYGKLGGEEKALSNNKGSVSFNIRAKWRVIGVK
jgi:hypothetical protein